LVRSDPTTQRYLPRGAVAAKMKIEVEAKPKTEGIMPWPLSKK